MALNLKSALRVVHDSEDGLVLSSAVAWSGCHVRFDAIAR